MKNWGKQYLKSLIIKFLPEIEFKLLKGQANCIFCRKKKAKNRLWTCKKHHEFWAKEKIL